MTRRWRIKNTEIVEELALPPVKVHCSVLAEDAIKAALKNYQDKQDAVDAAKQEPKRRLLTFCEPASQRPATKDRVTATCRVYV